MLVATWAGTFKSVGLCSVSLDKVIVDILGLAELEYTCMDLDGRHIQTKLKIYGSRSPRTGLGKDYSLKDTP